MIVSIVSFLFFVLAILGPVFAASAPSKLVIAHAAIQDETEWRKQTL